MEIKDVATWLGILASFGFNIINYRRTGQMWSRNQAFSEFKGLKTPVDAALSKMRENKAAWKSLEAFGGTPEAFAAEAAKLNSIMTEYYVALTTVLEPLDASAHSKRRDWVERLESEWETVVGIADRMYAPHQSLEQKKKILSAMVIELAKLIDVLAKELEEETNGKIGHTRFFPKLRK